MARVKKRWNQAERPRTLAQMANAIAATAWKLAAGVVLNLENENFETASQAQRLDLIEELLCYLVHCCDRWCHARAGATERAEFVAALVTDLARLLEDSCIDVEGPGDYRAAFVARVNARSGEYASYRFDDDEGAGFALRCRLGDYVQAAMGERDRRWVPDYIVGREAPDIEASLRRSLAGLVSLPG